MRRRVLLATFETPGYGGASSASYALFERMLQDGVDARFLSLIDAGQEAFLQTTFGPMFGNPRGLPHVHTQALEGAFHGPQPRLGAVIAALAPDVALCVGFIAALAVKQASPSTRVVFYTAGCNAIDRFLPRHGDAIRTSHALRTAPETLALQDTPHANERRAAELADLILVHSDLVRELYGSFHPSTTGKIYPDVIWMAEWIHGEAAREAALGRDFGQRDIDMLFVASRWDRFEKNLPLVREIVAGCPELRGHVVGLLDTPLASATCHGLVADRQALFGLMGRSKVVVSPSRFDAAPGVLYEASALGCNVVASRNCGNWLLCHEALVAEPFTAAGFIAAVRRATTRKFPDRMASLLATRSYATLLDICDLC